MGGGAWSLLVGGVICQVDYGNERDLFFIFIFIFLIMIFFYRNIILLLGNNRSVMPFDVPGDTRATIKILMDPLYFFNYFFFYCIFLLFNWDFIL